jgi:DNA-binding SARP family transcriptional activator
MATLRWPARWSTATLDSIRRPVKGASKWMSQSGGPMAAAGTDPLAGQVTVVLAAAGYGKTTAVRGWLADRPGAAGFVVVDDAHLVPGGPPAPEPGRKLVVVTRRPLPADRLRRLGPSIAEVGPARLALPVEAVARLLRNGYGTVDRELAWQVHRLTAGWPALAHLAAAALAPGGAPDDDKALAVLSAPGTPLAEYVRTEVLDPLPAAARRLLGDAARLGPVCADLAADLGHRRPEATLGDLARLGLLDPPNPGNDWYRVVPVLAAVIRAGAPRAGRRGQVLARGADWHHRCGRPADALRLRLAVGDLEGCRAVLAEHGARLVAAGAAADVVAALRVLPAGTDEVLLAEALDLTGDSAAAVARYARLAGDRAPLPAGLAWRYGMALYLWRDPRGALAVYRRGDTGSETTADEAMLLAGTAAVHWLLGELAACRDHADRALSAATTAGDDRALAAAHVAQALCADLAGDQVALQAHYARALTAAEAADDVIQQIRIRANLAAALERETRYPAALELVGPAVALAGRVGHLSLLAMATCNEGALLHRLGRFDEACDRYERSISAYQALGSPMVAYPLNGMGEAHRARGRWAEARTAFEEAARSAERDGNRQGLVPALVGLARILAPDDPAAATELARKALDLASGPLLNPARLAAGYAAIAAGDPGRAREYAIAATDSARQHRDRAGLAEALELRAAASTVENAPDGPAEARQALREALAIWRDAGAGADSDRVLAALGALPGARTEDRLQARLAAGRLSGAGVIAAAPTCSSDVDIRVLGPFAVTVATVPAPTWQSRKARDLLRILLARRGRPVARDELLELLWGGAGKPEKVAHRLAVALSTVRGVLDPGRRAPADEYIGTGPANIWLNLDRVAVDVETFLADAAHGLRLHARGNAEARTVLLAVEHSYVGEVFADDPYDDWAQPLREEAHGTYLQVLRALVRLGGGPDDTIRRLSVVLADDPYDERCHRDLVGTLVDAGRHGEARRAYDRYRAAMRDLGLAPAPML